MHPSGKTPFSGNVFALRQQNRKNGLVITPESTIPLWEGEKIDDSMAVEGLLWLGNQPGKRPQSIACLQKTTIGITPHDTESHS